MRSDWAASCRTINHPPDGDQIPLKASSRYYLAGRLAPKLWRRRGQSKWSFPATITLLSFELPRSHRFMVKSGPTFRYLHTLLRNGTGYSDIGKSRPPGLMV